MINTEWTRKLLLWFDRSKRSMPWRGEKDPYKILVSEIMLQQTRVEQATPFYLRFIERFPSLAELASSPVEEVLKAWNGLGYYRRGKMLHQCAKILIDQYQDRYPMSFEEWIKLPGIGRYTAGAVLSIAFELPFPAVDGNVARVISRFKGIREDISKDTSKKAIEELLLHDFPMDRCGDFTQSLMELGALVCLPHHPKCLLCPLSEQCYTKTHHLQEVLPVKKKKSPATKEQWSVFLVELSGCIMLVSRNAESLLSDFWGLPMLPVAPIQLLEEAFLAKYGLRIAIKEKLEEVRHEFSQREWHLMVHRAQAKSSKQELREDPIGVNWVNKNDLVQSNLAKPFEKILKKLGKW